MRAPAHDGVVRVRWFHPRTLSHTTGALILVGAALMAMMSGCGLLMPSSAKVARVVYFGPANVSQDNYALFQDALREAGWVEGQNLSLEWHVNENAEGAEAWMPALEDDFAHGTPIVLTTDSSAHGLALKQATSRVPIVVSNGDPLATGLVSNQAHPGGNITGVSTNPFSQDPKKLEIFKEVVPQTTHVGVLYGEPANPNLAPQLASFEAAGPRVGVQIAPIQVVRSEDLDTAIEGLDRTRVDALSVVQDVVTLGYVAHVTEVATRHGLPTMCARSDWVQLGCLLSYATNRPALTRMRVSYIDKVLRGARPGDLPIQQPTTFDLSVNLKTLQALGLSVPSPVQPLVTEWIE
jgi:putative ABC transport system substrate-binding protein